MIDKIIHKYKHWKYRRSDGKDLAKRFGMTSFQYLWADIKHRFKIWRVLRYYRKNLNKVFGIKAIK